MFFPILVTGGHKFLEALSVIDVVNNDDIGPDSDPASVL